jgi:hypothetical protein
MTRYRSFGLGLVAICALLGTSSGLRAAEPAQGGKSDTVRPEVGKPLQAAALDLKDKKFKEAAAKLHEAEAVKDKTAYEEFVVEQVRGAVAAGMGDTAGAIKSYSTIVGSGRLSGQDQARMEQALAGLYYQSKDYPKTTAWVTRYYKDGGADPEMRTLLIQSYYLGNDFASAAKEAEGQIQAEEKAGKIPPEQQLQLAANCYVQQKDNAGYANMLEKLVAYYPKKEYWKDIVHRISTRPGFADRLSYDAELLGYATGALGTSTELMELTQLALQAGDSGAAQSILDKAFASGALGSGSDVERQKRLRDLTAKTVAEDVANLPRAEADAAAAPSGDALVGIGYRYTDLGQTDKGVALMEKGVSKGGLKYPEDAKLHLGLAYIAAGQSTAAVRTLKTVQGTDGPADLARLWVVYLNENRPALVSQNQKK